MNIIDDEHHRPPGDIRIYPQVLPPAQAAGARPQAVVVKRSSWRAVF
jgi:hypothetical protein